MYLLRFTQHISTDSDLHSEFYPKCYSKSCSFISSVQIQTNHQIPMLLTEVDTCPSSLCSSSPSQDSFLYLLRDLAFQPFTLYIMYCYQTLCILYIVLHMWSLYDVRPLFCWCCTFNFSLIWDNKGFCSILLSSLSFLSVSGCLSLNTAILSFLSVLSSV